MLETVLVISVLINLLSFFYIRWLLKTVAVINQEVEQVMTLISDFQGHIKSVYELEMFYGDETLKSLMDHSRSLVATLQDLDLILNEQDTEYYQEEALIEEKEAEKKEN